MAMINNPVIGANGGARFVLAAVLPRRWLAQSRLNSGIAQPLSVRLWLTLQTGAQPRLFFAIIRGP